MPPVTRAPTAVSNNPAGKANRSPCPPPQRGQPYTARAGDSWASLARRVYGDASLAPKLAAHNGNGPVSAGRRVKLPHAIATDSMDRHTRAGGPAVRAPQAAGAQAMTRPKPKRGLAPQQKRAQAKKRVKARKRAEGMLERVGWEAGKVDGKIDNKSRAAIRGFQKTAGLAKTGKLDDKTRAKLKQAARHEAKGVLSAGQRSNPVKRLEQRLKAAGFNPGKVDRKFDARTARAVKAFKRARKELKGQSPIAGKRMQSVLANVTRAGGASSAEVMGRARSIGGQINATGGYRFDGYNDCWGFVRRVLDPVMKRKGLPAIPTADAGTSAGRRNWDAISSWSKVPVGTPLSTHEGHAWGAQWHGGLFAGVKNGVPYIYDNSGSRSAQLRPMPPGLFKYFHKPSAQALG
jgi:peptidoglycan hydrolase-like protein with peptidoglycan-binding domain